MTTQPAGYGGGLEQQLTLPGDARAFSVVSAFTAWQLVAAESMSSVDDEAHLRATQGVRSPACALGALSDSASTIG